MPDTDPNVVEALPDTVLNAIPEAPAVIIQQMEQDAAAQLHDRHAVMLQTQHAIEALAEETVNHRQSVPHDPSHNADHRWDDHIRADADQPHDDAVAYDDGGADDAA